MRKNTVSLLLAVSGLLCAVPALGEDELPALEQLFRAEIEGASRYAQPLTDAPATATVISAQDISRFGHQTLGDALNTVRGAYATDDHAYSYLGVRGFSPPGDYNSRILMTVDGARYNDVVYDQAMLGHEAPIDVSWIKRLEFVSGPASALYGGNALFGVANAVLWSGADIDGTRVEARAGRNGLLGGTLLSGRAGDDGGDWVAGLSFERGAGDDIYFREFAVPGVSDGVARDIDGARWIKGFARYSNLGWRITANYTLRNKDVPTAYYGTDFGAHGNFVRDEHAHVDAVYSSALANGWVQFARLHFGRYSYDAEYVYSGAKSRDEALASWGDAEYRLAFSGWTDHRVQMGFEARRNMRMDQRYFDLAPRVEYLDDHRSGGTVGAFVQDEWHLARQWILNLGLRADNPQGADSISSPRLALIYRPRPGTSAKLIHGRAFRVANAYERFYADGSTQKANPALKPERIEASEIFIEHALTPGLRLGLGHYLNRMTDVVSQAVDPADGLMVFGNQSRLTARGWELEAEAQFDSGWRARGNWSWQHAKEQNQSPLNSPRKLGKFLFDGPLPATGWNLALEIQAVSSRLGPWGQVPGHAVANLSLQQASSGPWGQWSIGWRNFGDTGHAVPASSAHVQAALPQSGRQWQVRWSQRL